MSGMVGTIEIVATGARTPIGLVASLSAAALRGGIMRVREHDILCDRAGEPVMGAMDARLEPELQGPQRLLAMLEPALREASEPLLSIGGTRRPQVPLLLALPEQRPGFTLQDAAWIQQAVAGVDLPAVLAPVVIATEGHAAGLSGVALAVEQIRAGQIEACLVAGVDSYFDPATIRWLEQHRQLAGPPGVRSGFVPGEGAGACLLMSAPVARSLGLPSQGQVLAASTALETHLIKTDEICVGTGLTGAIQLCLAQLGPDVTIDDIICDINGERYRSEEWGFASLQAWRGLNDPSGFRSPADTWGDMGAASGPLFIMLACQAALRGYARGPTTLIWTSSEHGLRSAVALGLGGGRRA